MSVQYHEANEIFYKMSLEFRGFPENEKIAMAFITIHQDRHAYDHIVSSVADIPAVKAYYLSRWNGGARSDEERKLCKFADSQMPKWHDLYAKHKAAFWRRRSKK